MNTFADCYTTYRMKAAFVSHTAFANALAQKGYFYDISLFSHWKKGTRIPTNRHLLLTLIVIFIERKALHTIDEANTFMASAGLGYLTRKEIKELGITNHEL